MAREFPGQPVLGVGAVVLRAPGTAAASSSLEVLLVRRANPPSQHEWSIPGGAVEIGERLQDAVVREVHEETGLVVRAERVIEVFEFIESEGTPPGSGKFRYHYVLIDFVCRVVGGRLAPASDALDACWLSIEALEAGGTHALKPRTIDVIRTSAATFSRR